MQTSTNSRKLKGGWKNFLVGVVKNVYGQPGHQTQKLTVSEEWTDRVNWFFACWYRSKKVKSWSKFFGWECLKTSMAF